LGLCFCFHKKNWEYNNKKQINFNSQKIKDKFIKEIFLDILVNMASTIDMQEIRYLNLFERIMGVRTRFCFKYNEAIVFCVPKPLVHKSVGEGGRNIREMSEILDRRIKVVAQPEGLRDAEYFIRAVVSPTTFRNFEIRGNEILISGGDNKAILIGRNKRRLFEMQKIVKDFFGKEFRIV